MEILKTNQDINLILNTETDFQTNLGWEENMQQYEDEVLSDIINPIVNYETVRYIHDEYHPCANIPAQSDIWFYFYFSTTGNSPSYVLDYNPIGITFLENEHLLKQSTKSFFRLEFFKTPGIVSGNTLICDAPNRTNRKLVFAKNLSIPNGQKYYYNNLNGYIHVPVFMGSNYEKKENMYFYWFDDESALNNSNLSGSTTGNTFFMTAKFYNAVDGSILDFTNSGYTTGHTVTEENDLYYQIDINKVKHSYKVYQYSGHRGDRVGYSDKPILFFEKGGASAPTPIPTLNCPTPLPSANLCELSGIATIASLIPSPTPTPTHTPTPTPTKGTIPPDYYIVQCCNSGVDPNYYTIGNGIFFTGKTYQLIGGVGAPPTMDGINCWTVISIVHSGNIISATYSGGDFDSCSACFVNSIEMYSGTSVTNACNNQTSTTYYFQGNFPNVQLYQDSILNTVADGTDLYPRYYHYNDTVYMITGSEGQINETTYTCPPPITYTAIYPYTGLTTTDVCTAKDDDITSTLYIVSTDSLIVGTIIYLDNLNTNNHVSPMYMILNQTLYHINSSGAIYDVTANYHCL